MRRSHCNGMERPEKRVAENSGDFTFHSFPEKNSSGCDGATAPAITRRAWHSVTEEIFTLQVTPGGAWKHE